MRDTAFTRAALVRSFTEDDPEVVFASLRDRLCLLAQTRDPDLIEELIQYASCFVEFRQRPDFVSRCRDICAFGQSDDDMTRLARAWFTDHAPYREGIPRADDQNAQLLISLPRGVQRARARLNNRGHNEALMRSPFPDVIEILCANPAIREPDVTFMASRRPTQNKLLEPVLASQWVIRPEVRFALAANPYIQTSHAIRCAATLSRHHLMLLSDMNELHPQLRALARCMADLFF